MSDVLFWQQKLKQDDPFLEPSLPLAFYHPSLLRTLTKEESQTKLSPEKLQPSAEDKKNGNECQLTPQEQAFMSRTNTVLAKELPTRDTPSPPDNSSKFNESWPTSERPSSIESPLSLRSSSGHKVNGDLSGSSVVLTRAEEGELLALLKKQSRLSSSSSSSSFKINEETGRPTTQPQHSSVLARYIHRFRHAAPQSREERAGDPEGDLWWLSPPTRDTTRASSSDGQQDITSKLTQRMPGINKEERPVRRLSSNPARKELSSIPARRGSSSIPARRGVQLNNVPLMDTNKLSASSDRDGLSSVDAETLLLQEKAQHLLELSESSLLSVPIVSSEGIGSSSPSQPSSDEKVYIPPDISPITGPESKHYLQRELSQLKLRDQKRLYQDQTPLYQDKLRDQTPLHQDKLRDQTPLHQDKLRDQTPLHQENDILYQWRLRRKVEVARNQGKVSNHQNTPTLDTLKAQLQNDRISTRPTTKPETPINTRRCSTHPVPQTAVTETSFDCHRTTCINSNQVTSNVTNRTGTAAHHVTPHLHMSCDIIPCHHSSISHHHQYERDNRLTREPSHLSAETNLKESDDTARLEKDKSMPDGNDGFGTSQIKDVSRKTSKADKTTDKEDVKVKKLEKQELKTNSRVKLQKSKIPTRQWQSVQSQRTKEPNSKRIGSEGQDLSHEKSDMRTEIQLVAEVTHPIGNKTDESGKELARGNEELWSSQRELDEESERKDNSEIDDGNSIAEEEYSSPAIRGSSDTEPFTDVSDGQNDDVKISTIGQVLLKIVPLQNSHQMKQMRAVTWFPPLTAKNLLMTNCYIC
ncbi:uncharacterized protein [Apostichopus japonicus]|uniref:uncharacterized protein isoform X2 n=1 Tax=Stichopus japonicus TaxID=307972 RepID=UPI003AB6A82F